MSMEQNKRYEWLINTIKRNAHITLAELQRRWANSSLYNGKNGLSERTFHRDRKAIKEQLDYEILCDKSRDVYFLADNGDPKHDEVRQWMMESIQLYRIMKETSSSLRNRILLEHVPTISNLIPLIEALKSKSCVEVSYQKFHDDEPIMFIAHPYCLKHFRQRWYLLARRDDLGELRTYALDRILDLKPTKQPAVVPADFDAQTHFDQYFGIFTGMNVEPCPIVLRVTNKEAKYLDTLPLHHSQIKLETNDTHTTYRYRLAPTHDFRMDLLSRGAAVEVIEPQWLRDDICQQVKAMLKNYNK